MLAAQSRALIVASSLFIAASCGAEAVPPKPAAPEPLTTVEQVHRLVGALNAVDRFPVSRAALEVASGVRLTDVATARVDGISISLSGDELIDDVQIEASGMGLAVPPIPSRATRYDLTTYTYLPTVEHVERVGDRYRSLFVETRPENPGDADVTRWTYAIDGKRGPFFTDDEKEGGRAVMLGLLQAIQEDRFEAAYQDFVKRFPEGRWGSHQVFDTTYTIRYFDDRIPERADDFLAKDGLIAYVGIHVYVEQYSEVRYPHPWLFEFFGVDRVDAARPFQAAPYNPIEDASHPMAGVTSTLPDISAAGHREGGLVHYSFLEWRGGPWTFECPGFYPHDGKTVPTMLDPALLQIGSFAVTHSRKKPGKR